MKPSQGTGRREVRVSRITGSPESIAAAALWLFGLIAAAVTVVAVVESYSNLLAFALAYGLHGWRAAIAPAAVDSFVVMGELLVFAAILLHWHGRAPYALGAGMALWGFLLSVGGNVWHAPAAAAVDRAVSAIWPVTATAGLAGGLIIIKRVMSRLAGQDPGLPLPASASREPRPSRRASAAREAAPAAARSQAPVVTRHAAWIRELAGSGKPLPRNADIAADKRLEGSPATRKRHAQQILAAAAAGLNGNGDDHRDSS